MESLKSLVSVARRVLKEENQDNAHESDANENVKGTLKRLYLSISYNSRVSSTSKSKVLSSKHSEDLLTYRLRKKIGPTEGALLLI